MNKITVMMSAYNGSQYITQQLDSIFAQKEVDVTCFVRDDGSKDDTLSILSNYILIIFENLLQFQKLAKLSIPQLYH